MKFCIISQNHYSEFIGGAEIQCNYIAKELLNHKHEVFYICISQKYKYSYIDSGIKVFPIYLPGNLDRILSKVMPLRLLIEFILLFWTMKKVKADLWYYRSVNTFLVSLVKIKKKIGGKLIYALSADLQTNKTFLINKFGKYYFQRLIKSLNSVEYFVFQTETQKSAFHKQFGYSGKVIYNGHPFENSIYRAKETILITWIANLKRIKQPECFFNLVKKYKNQNVEFHMAGKLTMDYKKDLQDLQQSDIRFKYHGVLNNQDVLTLINKSYILINTSRSEGFSNVFIESWKFGIPIISFLDPDNILSNYNVGFTCKNEDEMIGKIDLLINDKNTYEKISNNCFHLFRDQFSIETNVNELFTLINI